MVKKTPNKLMNITLLGAPYEDFIISVRSHYIMGAYKSKTKYSYQIKDTFCYMLIYHPYP